jgi:NMD protein affecting ribosome stability and mRNA decay
MTSSLKPAICCKCGKDLKDKVPAEAGDVTCFACYVAPHQFGAVRDIHASRNRVKGAPSYVKGWSDE